MDKPRLPSRSDRTTAGSSGVRARVAAHWRRLAPLALVTAAPLLNAACDPAPQPACVPGGNQDWRSTIEASAHWVAVGTAFQVEVTFHSTDPNLDLQQFDFDATGGQIVSQTYDAATKSMVVLVAPVAVDYINVYGRVACDGGSSDINANLTLSPNPVDGAAIPVTVQ